MSVWVYVSNMTLCSLVIDMCLYISIAGLEIFAVMKVS